MDALSAVFSFLLWLFGVVEEQRMTREQCEQLWAPGYVVYPLNDTERARIDQCAEMMADE